MSTPSPTVRFNKRKPSFESLGQSAFYPDGSTSSAATNGATADKNPPDLRRKSPRTNKSISATDVIPSEAPASVPLAPAPSWPPGRITRALPPGDLVKIHLTVPPISRWQTLSNERPIHISTPFSSWVYPNRASPGASVDPTPSLLGNIAYVNSHGHLTPPRERFSHSELLQLKNENREIWWSVEQLARADSATDLPNLGHLALDSPSPDIGNALGLYTSSPSIPLPPLPQGNITRLPSAPVSRHETTASFDNLLMLLDSDIRSEIINFSGPSFKSADNGHSLNMWSNANLERGLSSKVEKAGEESEVAEQISALRRGSTSELPSQQVLVDGRPLLSSYTMPALSHMGLPCSPDTSVEMPRSVTPSPIGRSPTPSPLNFFYQDTETSDLIDPYYLGEDSSEVEPGTAPMEVESRDVAEPETPANPMRFWRSRDTSPDRLDRERDTPSSSASMLSRFIRDLPMVPDYDRDNAQDLWPQSPGPARSRDCPPEMNETSEDRAEFLPEGDEDLFDLSFRRAVALEDQPIDDKDMEHDDYDYEQDDVEYEDEYEYDDYNVSDDDQFPHSRATHREAERVQSEPIYHIGQFEQQPRPIPVLAPGPAPHLARYASQYLNGRILNPDFAVRYDIVDELGKGAFGFVCTALDKQRNVEVAVKFIYKYPNVRQGMRIHMIGHEPRESHILSRLNHPGIISFIDLFEDAEYFYMASHSLGLCDLALTIRCRNYMAILGGDHGYTRSERNWKPQRFKQHDEYRLALTRRAPVLQPFRPLPRLLRRIRLLNDLECSDVQATTYLRRSRRIASTSRKRGLSFYSLVCPSRWW
jgi:hypothetical protein